MIDAKVYETALEQWGVERQLNQLVEECAELIVAVRHYDRDREGARAALVEELADVGIMVGQIVEFIGRAEVEGVARQKVDRLRIRLGMTPTRAE